MARYLQAPARMFAREQTRYTYSPLETRVTACPHVAQNAIPDTIDLGSCWLACLPRGALVLSFRFTLQYVSTSTAAGNRLGIGSIGSSLRARVSSSCVVLCGVKVPIGAVLL